MKINYRPDTPLKRNITQLDGVRRATELVDTPEKILKREKESKRLHWGKILFMSFVGFILVAIVGYFAQVPAVQWAVAYVRDPQFSVAQTTYKTFKLQYDESLPSAIKTALVEDVEKIELNGQKRFSTTEGETEVKLLYTAQKEDSDIVLFTDYLIPVGHIYWVRDTATKAGLSKDGIFIDEKKVSAYKTVIDGYLGADTTLKTTKSLTESLRTQEKSIGFVSFSELNASYKILQLDGKNFLEKPNEGGITFYLVLRSDSSTASQVLMARLQEKLPTVFDPSKVLSVRMTGVTAITRSLGIKSSASGDTAYAARKIGDFLSKADLTHVSNEISNLKNCAYTGGVSFCTKPEHIDALKKSGVDIVELTGNHNNDKGSTANADTINTYKKLGWSYFGGGLNSTDAAEILYKEVKGTKVAFLGYNYYDTVYGTGAIASSTRAGANSWSAAKITRDVAEARKNDADVVIVDFQYQECWAYTDDGSTVKSCYSPIASPNQTKDFRQAIDAGADIVIGAQAHQPQTYEVYKGKNIFYGLGNLYFDQTQQLGTRQGLILTHYFYEGRYLSTTLTTTIYDNDLLTYVTTGSQRTQLLNSLKAARR
jgi:poly-gamma-glutamate synthesis protein (capsule biosynthesis protein)